LKEEVFFAYLNLKLSWGHVLGYLQLLAGITYLHICLEVMVEVPAEDLVEVETTMGSK